MSGSVLLLGVPEGRGRDFVDLLGRGKTRYEVHPSDVVPDSLDDYRVIVVWLAEGEHDYYDCARLVAADMEIVKQIRARSDAAIIAVNSCRNSTAIGVEALAAGCESFIGTNWPYVNWVVLLQQTVDIWYCVKEPQSVAAC